MGNLYFKVAEIMGMLVSLLNNTYFGDSYSFYFEAMQVLLVPYCAARAFIVIEAFISLRSLLENAYKTPDWTSCLPLRGRESSLLSMNEQPSRDLRVLPCRSIRLLLLQKSVRLSSVRTRITPASQSYR